MTREAEHDTPQDTTEPRYSIFVSGGGVSGAQMRSVDWSTNPLGPPETWPESLKTTLGVLFYSRHPMFLFWGPELICFYNDAYLPSFGVGKHPAAMGQRGEECWREIWPIIRPQIDDVMRHAKASWNVDHLVPIFRNGRIEEVYWTYSYSPVFDERGSVGGTVVVCTETTSRVLSDRRLRTMQALTERALAAKGPDEVVRAAAEAFGENGLDIPFALIYLFDSQSKDARFVQAVGAGDGEAPSPRVTSVGSSAELASLASRALQSEEPVHLANARGLLPSLPSGSWPEAVTDAYLVPIKAQGGQQTAGFILFGVSPQLAFDEGYQRFFAQLAAQTSISIQVKRSKLQAEMANRELQAAVAARDMFLGLASHELKTPLTSLTLQVQMSQKTLKKQGLTAFTPEKVQKLLDTVNRQAGRLTRLVNDMLDISRISSGKLAMNPERFDLAQLVRETVDRFAQQLSAVGCDLVLDLEPSVEVNWDPHRIEQVIANLITNAIRYAPGAPVHASLKKVDAKAVFAVKDYGPGIAEESLERVFERFERIGASANASGLGLGLHISRQIVQAHGGEIHAEGELGKGSRFVVEIPLFPERFASS